MSNILSSLVNPSNQTFIAVCVALSGLRVAIELTRFSPANWPISKQFSKNFGEDFTQRFHKVGLYICIGQIILWAPELLFAS
ncbi:hypothetical protein ACRXCV_10035 [Halobacteriovorax sp. GFR7]|uniref:hypothetical protein n=1 Tax=unclassified Halobacteriovorax TaxID=2639665 RepID=UPI000CD2DE86|nr:hypothetical protein [Halobacteriovorax sp. DA5]POB14564.1 hypothetical protein C0Z22_05580 [Halobacteriovorax sp. DA5]